MSVGYEVNRQHYTIGSSSFFHSFFSTICFHLENKKWGNKYPYLMKELYQGKLKVQDAYLVLSS